MQHQHQSQDPEIRNMKYELLHESGTYPYRVGLKTGRRNINMHPELQCGNVAFTNFNDSRPYHPSKSPPFPPPPLGYSSRVRGLFSRSILVPLLLGSYAD